MLMLQIVLDSLMRVEHLPVLDLGDLSAQRHLLALFSFLLEEFHTMSFADPVRHKAPKSFRSFLAEGSSVVWLSFFFLLSYACRSLAPLLQLLARTLVQFIRPAHASEFRGRFFDCEAALPLCRADFAAAACAAPFLMAIETDSDVLQKLLRALVSRGITRAQPALYTIAIHHIACLVFGQDEVMAMSNRAYLEWREQQAAMVRSIGVRCVQALRDDAYGDLLRHRWVQGSLPIFPSEEAVHPQRIEHLRQLCALERAEALFAARHPT
jgi:hypothetical protein